MTSSGVPENGRSIPYQPALDGIRAVAVVIVLAFHLEMPGAQGGYLGVSIFFTLSGYLITRLLLEERSRTGHIDMRRYLARRARRLLPASLLALALIVVLAAADVFGPSGDLRRSIWAALAQIFNWFELGSGDSYADLFVAPSPVAHFWSLAIEEQFYWIWPAGLLGVSALVRRGRGSALVWISVAFAVTAVSAPVTALLWSSDAAYLATWTRAAEILAGAVVAALVVAGRPVGRLAPAVLPLGLLLIAVMAVTPAGRSWPYHGGLPVFAAVGALVIAGLHGESASRRALGWLPAVWVGRVSYGLYLFHWPVILWLTPGRTGWSYWPNTLLRVVVTVAITLASYFLIEQPIRQTTLLHQRRAVFAGTMISAAALATAALLFVPVPPPRLPPAPVVLAADGTDATTTADVTSGGIPIAAPPEPSSTSDSALSTDDVVPATTESATAPSIGAPTSPATNPPTSPPTTELPTVVAIFGDSVPAWLLRDAAPTYDRADVVVVNGAFEACDGMIDQPPGRDRRLVDLLVPDSCVAWPTSYAATLEEAPAPPDAAVLVLGQSPVVDRFVDGRWQHPCDGIGWYTEDLADRIAWLRQRAIPVQFALPARAGDGATFIVPDDVDERVACIRNELDGFLEAQGVPVVDLDVALCPADQCDDVRIDGIHVRPELASGVLDWLLDEVLALIPDRAIGTI